MARIITARLEGRPAAFFSNPGNLGDALIEAGAQQFLSSNGIAYRFYNSRLLRELHEKHFKLAYAKNRLLESLSLGTYVRYPLSLTEISQTYDAAIICGSGGFSNSANVALQIQELCSEYFADVIVLPSTYAIAPNSTRNTLFFSRDRFDSQTTAPFASFCHDMAFYLHPDAAPPPQRSVGYHLRTDNESSGKLPVPDGNFDISNAGIELDTPDRLFHEVAKSALIVTDRLHVCIAAALIGRQVYLFAGNYFKISAIYNSSIAPHFSNVTLMHRWEELPAWLRA